MYRHKVTNTAVLRASALTSSFMPEPIAAGFKCLDTAKISTWIGPFPCVNLHVYVHISFSFEIF